jgi:hypothetical protein
MLIRICFPVTKAERDLFICGLGMGDLVQLHSAKTDPKTNTPFDVIVGYGYYEDHEDVWMSRGWYFKYLDSGILGVYISRVPPGKYSHYWAKFHKVHCDGATCIVHEKYLFPLKWEYDPTNPPMYAYKPLYLSNIGSTGSF